MKKRVHRPGFNVRREEAAIEPASPDARSGLVISNYGAALQVQDSDGVIHRCTARKKIENLVCGDRVRWQATRNDEGVIVALEPRRTLLVRPDARGQLKPMAANVDQLVMMMAPRRSTQPERALLMQAIDEQLLDRYLVAATLCNIDALIVINKSDFFTPEGRADAERLAETYRAIGYRVLFTAAKFGEGLAPLIDALNYKVSVISGQSGVGKSSLAKALHPKGDIKIGEVSNGSGAGRHTTTLAALYHLESGGDLIDSPGVRDFALWQVSTVELARGFIEFRASAPYCRFGDCRHTGEPGCAVELAAERGEISARRLANYRHIAATLRA